MLARDFSEHCSLSKAGHSVPVRASKVCPHALNTFKISHNGRLWTRLGGIGSAAAYGGNSVESLLSLGRHGGVTTTTSARQ